MAICIQKVFGAPCEPITEAQFEATLDDPAVAETYKACREAYRQYEQYEKAGLTDKAKRQKAVYDERKRALPAWIFSCCDFVAHEWIDSKKVNHGTGKWRHQEHGLLNGLYMVDLDHLDDPMDEWRRMLKADVFANQYRPQLLLAYMTPSGHGLKLVLVCDVKHGNLASNQNAFCKDLGLANDNSTKDSSRLSFVCPRSEVLYYDARLHEVMNADFIRKYQPLYSKGLSEPDLFKDEENPTSAGTPKSLKATGKPQDTSAPECASASADHGAYRYEGLEIPAIISKWLEHFDTSPGKRHKVLLRLCSELKHVCERNEERVKFFVNELQWVKDLRAEGDSVDKTIEDGLNREMSMNMPKVMFATLKEMGVNPSIVKDPGVVEVENALMPKFIEYGKEIEALAPNFPCIDEVCYQMKTPSKPACLFVGAALFGTLMTRMHYFFYHRPEERRRLNYEVFVVDDPATGKSFASDLYKVILSPIIASDKVGNDLINKFKDDKNKNNTASDKQKKEGLVQPKVKIRIHGARTSNQTFIEDMCACVDKDAEGNPINLHLFTFDSELENNARLGSSGQTWIDKSVFELKAFHNEEDNQQYKNVDSISGPFNVYWNFVYTGTPVSLHKKVNLKTFGSGLYSRLAVLPLCAAPFDVIPLYARNKKNVEVTDTLKEWAFRLDTVAGELPIWPLVECSYKWMADVMMLAKEDDDRITAMLVKRAPYYGINIATPYIFMRHYEEWVATGSFKVDDTDKKLVILCLEIQLCTQRHFFGGMAAAYRQNKYSEEQSNKVNYYSKSDKLLAALPSVFTVDDVIRIGEISSEYARVQCWRWEKDKKIAKSGRGKSAKYSK